MQVYNLQELNWFTHAAHSVEHETTHLVHEATPDLKWAATETWHGATACAANAECKAAVEKYGTAAVEDAMKLQELNWFSGAWDTIKHDVSGGFNSFKNDCDNAAKKLGPDFKIAGSDMKWAAGKTWQGAKWCYNDAPCKAMAIKYGTKAVEAGMTAAALQELNWFSGAWDTVKHDAGTAEHAVVHGFHEATPDLKWAAGEAWKGATACYSNPVCKAAAEKYGMEAVKAAMKKTQLQELKWNPWKHPWNSRIPVKQDIVGKDLEAAMKKTQLQELNWHHFWHHVKHDAGRAVHGVAKVAKEAEHGVVHVAHEATPDLKKMAGLAWKGTKWCYADATCKANVEKYGLAATEAACALQVIILI